MKHADIAVTSVISARNGLPFVQIRWGEMGGQMTPEEARQHAYGILEAAESAESDAIMIKFLTETLGAKMDDAAQILKEFRKFREQKKIPTVGDGAHRHT